MASSRSSTGSRHGKQPESSTSLAAAVIASATNPSAATKAGKNSKACFSASVENVAPVASAEDLLDQCKCPISLELMRRPVLPSSGQAFDEINLLRWGQNGNTKCPVSGSELLMRKNKMQYTKHHLLRNIIRQQAEKAKVYIPPVEKDQLLLDLRKPGCTAKALQALFDDRCLGYVEKEVVTRTLKDLVKRKNKLGLETDGQPFNLLQMIIRCCLATRKTDLIRYGRKLLKDETALWRDPEVIAEVLGLAEDTEHRGDILLDIEARVTDTKVGPKEFVKAVLRHRSEKNPVQRTLDRVASEVLSFKAAAYQAADWAVEDKGELLNMALAALHSQCVDAGVCCAQIGLGSARWTKALADLQGLGCSLSRSNLEILFGSPVHAQALQQVSASSARSSLEWHLDQHDSSFVGMLCLDHIAMPPQPLPHLLGRHSHLDFGDHPDTSSDEDLEDDEDLEGERHRAFREFMTQSGREPFPEALVHPAAAELLAGLDSEEDEEEDSEDVDIMQAPQAPNRRMTAAEIEADLRAHYLSTDSGRPAQRRRTR